MKVSELPQAAELTGEELLPVVQNGETKKVTRDELVGVVPDDIVIEDNTISLLSKGQKIGEGATLLKITVDSELSAESENPVQNNVVTKAISDLNEEAEKSKSYTYNSFANALKGKVSGALLKIDDISPIPHKLTIKVQSENETDISGATVRRYGKNQFNSAKNMIASFGKAPEYIENGFRVTNRGVTSQVIRVFPNTDYNLSYILTEIEGTTEKHVTVYRAVNGIMSSAIKNFENDIGGTFNTGNNTEIQIRFFGTPTNSDEGTVEFTNIQLELGTEATEYEPYAVIEAEVAEDGTVEGITSAYPNTVIFADTPNVVFECEYNRDLNKAFNKVIEAIVSLGGNV